MSTAPSKTKLASLARKRKAVAVAPVETPLELDPAVAAFDLLTQPNAGTAHTTVKALPLDLIERGRFQPRQSKSAAFSTESIDALAESIKKNGVIQPIVVRPHPDKSGRYELVAGERRWRAAHRAQLDVIPAIIRAVTEDTGREIALIENLQRENLNPMEEALALDTLKTQHQLTIRQLGEALGKAKSWVDDRLKLLRLAPGVQDLVFQSRLAPIPAGLLAPLPLELQEPLAACAVERGWSQRQLAAAIKNARTPAVVRSHTPPRLDPNLKLLVERIERHFAAPVKVQHNAAKNSGQITIKYHSLDELDGILQAAGIATDVSDN